MPLTQIVPNEGKDWLALNGYSGETLYYFLVRTYTIFGGTLDVNTTRTSLSGAGKLESWTGFARQQVVFGASTNGISVIPTATFNTGSSTDGHSDITAYGLMSSLTVGVVVCLWDLPATVSMAAAGAQIVIPSQSFFLFNPGEA